MLRGVSRTSLRRLTTRPCRPKSYLAYSCFNNIAKKRTLATAAIIPASVDDQSLVSVFDHAGAHLNSPSGSYTGLFGHSTLTSPQAFTALTDSTLLRARLLTERIVRARESRDEMRKVVKNLDRVSDLLCGVIDMAELIRNAHPSKQWVDSANEAYEKLCEFMNVLNTHVELYEVLAAVLADQSIVSTLSPEAYQTALIFWRDFEKSAINLPVEQRERFVTLSSEILVLGRQFLNDAASPRPPATIKPEELQGLKDHGMGARLQLQSRFTRRDLLVYPGSMQAHMIMQRAPSEEPRKKVYMAAHTSTPTQIEVLERLLHTRAELARVVGRQSYAEMALGDKMAKSPENVSHFLETLMDYRRPHALDALHALGQRKQVHLGLDTLPVIQAWDRDYYCPPDPPAPAIPLPSLSIGTVFMALSRLYKHLYGISLRPAGISPGEVWHNDVSKLEVFDEDEGLIGWIYTDVHVRRGKASGAAHYTVRCSRRIDDDDEAGDLMVEGGESIAQMSVDFEREKFLQHRDGRTFQLPLVVLLCEFSRPPSNGKTILEWHEVVTLFHEMGHAMHSMIGRTEYHNVAGTRCATDFVELPSILMEHFLNSPTVLSLFDVNSTSVDQASPTRHEDPCRSIDTYSQIMLASLDQLYHSPVVNDTSFDSTTALAQLHNTRGVIPYVPGTSFQTQFGHLFSYGALYYSYLLDRAIAGRVWGKLFAHDPLQRQTGEKYKNEVLRYGGAKDPWAMVAALLDAPHLETGDAEAMKEVGRWRIEDEISGGHH